MPWDGDERVVVQAKCYCCTRQATKVRNYTRPGDSERPAGQWMVPVCSVCDSFLDWCKSKLEQRR